MDLNIVRQLERFVANLSTREILIDLLEQRGLMVIPQHDRSTGIIPAASPRVGTPARRSCLDVRGLSYGCSLSATLNRFQTGQPPVHRGSWSHHRDGQSPTGYTTSTACKLNLANLYASMCQRAEELCSSTDLYNDYLAWCRHHDHPYYTKPSFINVLRNSDKRHLEKFVKGRSKGWHLRINEPFD